MRRLTFAVPAVLALVMAAGCNDLDVGDLNNPGLNELQESPTRVGILALATGMQLGSRTGMGTQNGYNVLLGILGREVYNFDAADPRFITEMLVGPLDGGSTAFGGNLFQQFYANIRTGNILLGAMGNLTETDPTIGGLSAAEREGLTGYVQTMQAYDYLRALNSRDDNGIPLDVNIDPVGPPAPIATKAEAFTRITFLLDEAATHLQSAGSAFPFAFSPGFADDDLNTPPAFRQFNRALRARVAAYMASEGIGGATWTDVINALNESFLSSAEPLSRGVYHSFSVLAGDSTNNLFDPSARAIVAHPSLATDAQLQGNAQPDQRFLSKTTLLAAPKTALGLTSDRAMNVYTGPTAGIPIIKNEELILLRAEARIQLNDLVNAVIDLNEIRNESGNLGAYSGAVTQPALIDELLYNRRYSLLFEGGHRWLDLRRYGRLGTLSQEVVTGSGPAHRFSRFPFPTNECLARAASPPASGCTTEPGF